MFVSRATPRCEGKSRLVLFQNFFLSIVWWQSQKSCKKCEVSQMTTVWMENKLWKSCAVNTFSLSQSTLYSGTCCNIAFLSEILLFLFSFPWSCTRETPQSLEINKENLFATKRPDKQSKAQMFHEELNVTSTMVNGQPCLEISIATN